ncbi:hypothetical protein CTRI78_v005372 [Colletotrichum trifolii]|uniref:Uncharacterized protein n=1 Tax=Colletotrichum trifolii TaxID=5466 RepID=A0A4R8RRB9_COLTR|nr:hypothetical protein CTRI78_v005372 [Colletotrichum trifolii]
MPREASSEDLSSSPDSANVQDMSRKELEVLAQERLNQIKVEAARRSGAGIKREASADNDERLRKLFKVDEDGTIDLTDD